MRLGQKKYFWKICIRLVPSELTPELKAQRITAVHKLYFYRIKRDRWIPSSQFSMWVCKYIPENKWVSKKLKTHQLPVTKSSGWSSPLRISWPLFSGTKKVSCWLIVHLKGKHYTQKVIMKLRRSLADYPEQKNRNVDIRYVSLPWKLSSSSHSVNNCCVRSVRIFWLPTQQSRQLQGNGGMLLCRENFEASLQLHEVAEEQVEKLNSQVLSLDFVNKD